MMNHRISTVIMFLTIFLARTHTRGDRTPSAGPNLIRQSQASVPAELRSTDFKGQRTFMEGSDVILKCDHPKIEWRKLIYIIWNISLQSKTCWLGFDSSTPNNTCNDGKKLLNSSDRIFLFIPKISKEDEGSYSCDVSYKGGGHGQNIHLSVHNLTSWLEVENGQTVAICQASYKQSEPILQWKPALNFSSNTSYIRNSDKSFIVENRVYLPDNVSISNLTCLATYPHLSDQQNLTNPEIITIVVGSICFILLSVAGVYILHRKLNNLSALKTMCCQLKSSTPVEEKPPQLPDVEEVEPYASYIQRVNSIYNSSAELFNA